MSSVEVCFPVSPPWSFYYSRASLARKGVDSTGTYIYLLVAALCSRRQDVQITSESYPIQVGEHLDVQTTQRRA